MNKRDTWIKLYRCSLNSQVFQNAELWKVWCYCLMRANHEDCWVAVLTGRGETEVELKRGQFIYGRKQAAKDLRMKQSSVRNRMKKLENMPKRTILLVF